MLLVGSLQQLEREKRHARTLGKSIIHERETQKKKEEGKSTEVWVNSSTVPREDPKKIQPSKNNSTRTTTLPDAIETKTTLKNNFIFDQQKLLILIGIGLVRTTEI